MDLYTDWMLNMSISKKFKAFKQGFDLVMSQSCLADLVMAEELEIIICGSTVSVGPQCQEWFTGPTDKQYWRLFMGLAAEKPSYYRLE